MLKLNSEVIIFFGCASVFSALVFLNEKTSPSLPTKLHRSPTLKLFRGTFVCLCEEDAEYFHSSWGCALFVDAGLKVCSRPDALSGNNVRCLGIYEFLCFVDLRDDAGKVRSNLWFLNLVQTRISGPVFDGPPPNVLSLNRLISSCYRWWTFWTEPGISGPSLCFSELRPQWRGLLFSVVL